MLPLISMAAGLIPQVANLFTAGKQKKMGRAAAAQADQLNQQALGYANNILLQAKGDQSEARNLYNARMANAGAIEKDIFQNQANTIGALSKNATDASQLLQLAGAVQGNTNNAFNSLSQVEAEDKQRRYYNLLGANQGVQSAYGNLQNYYGNQASQAQQSANQLMQSGMTNQANAINGIANIGMMAGMGQFGDLGSMFKGSMRPNATYTKSVQGYNPFTRNTSPTGKPSSMSGFNPINFSQLPPLRPTNLTLPSIYNPFKRD